MLFKKFKFRNKLLASFLLVFVPLILAVTIIAYYQVKKILVTSIENELNNATTSLSNLIQTSAGISIKNRLEAIAEKNLDLTEYYYNKYQSGLLPRKEAIKIIEEIFLNQSIGISGYIYCIDSKGNIIIHPNDKLKGTNVLGFDFIKQQIKIKDGYLEYDWKNPGEPHKRPKALYMAYYKPLDWIISVSSYRNEFSDLVDINDFKKDILSFTIGKSGYAFVLDEEGTAVIHPHLQGADLLSRNNQPNEFIRQIISMKNGKLRYFWKNPDEAQAREKIIIFKHLPGFKWIVGTTGYVKEIFSPLQALSSFLFVGLVITLLFTIFLTYIISRSITRPLEKLIQKFETGTRDDFSIRMDYEAPDELGQLSTHFNSFMDRLEDYHGKLNNEIEKNRDTQAALVGNELKLRELFNQSFQYTCILSPQGTLEEVNQSALNFAECTEEDALLKPLWETLWWKDELKSRNKVKTAIHKAGKGELCRMETTIRDGKGDPRDIDISIKPVYNNSGLIEFLIAEARDITELKQAEQERRHLAIQLEKSQKMEAIGTLAGGIAHDFNNILSSIFGYSQLAEMTIHTPEKSSKHIAQIVKGAQRAADLVQQILTFSRQTEYKKHPLKLYLVIKESLKLIRSSIPTSIDFKIEIQSRSMVMADHTQMHQVIMNLCTNAYHSMLETGGVLTVQLQDIEKEVLSKEIHIDLLVQLQAACNYLKLEITDTGHGMDPKTLKKAFNPYFTTKGVGRGTGFGLALVHAIVEEHGGIIHAESKLGIGSSFFVYLPIVEQDFPVQHIKKNLGKPRGGKETIMVVDDEKAIRLLTKELLENFGYTVHSFENGEDALIAFKLDPKGFDLIITDMTMPKMTGDIFAQKVLHINNFMPIILCTGYSENISKTRAMQIGIKKYLHKPLQNRDLLTIVRNILDTHNKTMPIIPKV